MTLTKRLSLNYKKVLKIQNELSMFKVKCEKLVSKSYKKSMVYIEKFEKEIIKIR